MRRWDRRIQWAGIHFYGGIVQGCSQASTRQTGTAGVKLHSAVGDFLMVGMWFEFNGDGAQGNGPDIVIDTSATGAHFSGLTFMTNTHSDGQAYSLIGGVGSCNRLTIQGETLAQTLTIPSNFSATTIGPGSAVTTIVDNSASPGNPGATVIGRQSSVYVPQVFQVRTIALSDTTQTIDLSVTGTPEAAFAFSGTLTSAAVSVMLGQAPSGAVIRRTLNLAGVTLAGSGSAFILRGNGVIGRYVILQAPLPDFVIVDVDGSTNSNVYVNK